MYRNKINGGNIKVLPWSWKNLRWRIILKNHWQKINFPGKKASTILCFLLFNAWCSLKCHFTWSNLRLKRSRILGNIKIKLLELRKSKHRYSVHEYGPLWLTLLLLLKLRWTKKTNFMQLLHFYITFISISRLKILVKWW